MQSQHTFTWEYARTAGYKNASLKPLPPDASNGVLYHQKREVGKKRGSQATRRRTHPASVEGNIVQKPSSVVNIHRQTTRAIRRRIDVHQFIQHAWAKAVEFDSTFIVFNCGLYERIGVRHRESQTLYLSPLIEPVNSRNPSYGKLHVGLHVAIIQDLLERAESSTNSGTSSKPGNEKKRPADQLDDHQPPKKKRKKGEMIQPDTSDAKVKDEMSKRELVLATLNYGIYCSPAPATFLRLTPSCVPGLSRDFRPSSKTKFRSTEYMDFTLLEPIGEGAVGVVHQATVSLTLANGQVMRHRVIVKLAFTREQREKLRHEYEVYSHLAKVGHVEGIVEVHGLFEDPDSSTLALVMEDGGQSLSQLNEVEVDRANKVTGDDRMSCLKALKSLHNVGVRHRDIRPANILFDAGRQVKIIDFDSATFDPLSTWQKKFDNEVKRLEEVLDGEYADGLWRS
ncbi:kinase-like protein [Agrocybe pediades]|nr:kinase-like protein [Agrocybe pediades]